MKSRYPISSVVLALTLLTIPLSLTAQDQPYLMRYTPALNPQPDDLTEGTETASYKPIFGKGDKDWNSNDVELLVLGSHGPTTQYKLLMGTTESTRDRLACASQMVSLFMMDFAPSGTNKPHRHKTQEEIYIVLRGYGNMVAGLDRWGNPMRHPCLTGDAFYFAAGTEVGFYSGGKPGEDNSIILAVRSDDPTFMKK